MNIVLIAAAGTGMRAMPNKEVVIASNRYFEASIEGDLCIPKQYQLISQQTMVLTETIRKFLLVPSIDFVQVIINPNHSKLYDRMLSQLMHSTRVQSKAEQREGQMERDEHREVSREEQREQSTNTRILLPCFGGGTRQESVYNGLKALRGIDPINVLVHDAARPFVSDTVINNVLALLNGHETGKQPRKGDVDENIRSSEKENIAVDVGLSVIDSLRSRSGDNIDRENLYHVQTPQGFRYETLWRLHQQARNDRFTCSDDIALCVRYSVPYGFVEGESCNYKITTRYDINHARSDYNL